jgi:hypothetical protein
MTGTQRDEIRLFVQIVAGIDTKQAYCNEFLYNTWNLSSFHKRRRDCFNRGHSIVSY